jgi:hypothetical protein
MIQCKDTLSGEGGMSCAEIWATTMDQVGQVSPTAEPWLAKEVPQPLRPHPTWKSHV